MSDIEKQLRQALEPAIKAQVEKLQSMAQQWANDRHLTLEEVAAAICPEIRVKAQFIHKSKCTSTLTTPTSLN